MLAKLTRIAWEVLSQYYKNSVSKDNTMSAGAEESAPDFLFLILTIHNRGVYACFIPGRSKSKFL